MTQAYTGPSSRVSGGAVEARGSLGNLRRVWTDYKAYRGTLEQLRALDDAQLAKLGFPRGTLKAIARNAVYGH